MNLLWLHRILNFLYEEVTWSYFEIPTIAFRVLFCSICSYFCAPQENVEPQIANLYSK